MAFARPAFAGVQGEPGFDHLAGESRTAYPTFSPPAAPAARRRPGFERRPSFLYRALLAPGVGLVLIIAMLAGVGIYGAAKGGQYDAFVAANGAISDLGARFLGFGIDSVTITGSRELFEAEVLAAAGITERNSLLFLDVVEVRDRLRQVPLVKDVNVRKLYPDRLLIELTEREPFAVWQKEGKVVVVSADGTPIQELSDARFTNLPFVVGTGANKRIGEFLKIVDSAGDLRTRIRAGILVGERRWNLKMTSGLDVKLPEDRPEEAIAQFARIAREARVLDKDLVSVDLRVPGRLFARLTEEAAAVRAESLSRKKKGGQT